MFCNAIEFNQPINNWDISQVTDISYMFCDAHAFNQPLDHWDTICVIHMDHVFVDAAAFQHQQSIQQRDLSHVQDPSVNIAHSEQWD